MAGALNTPLAKYLDETGPRPFAWGALDCVLFIAGWVKLVRGVDPAGPWREAYRSERGAQRLVARAGGMVALVSAAMDRAGVPETDAPMTGDVAIIETALGPTMAIRSPLGWVGKSPDGVGCIAATPLKAWSV